MILNYSFLLRPSRRELETCLIGSLNLPFSRLLLTNTGEYLKRSIYSSTTPRQSDRGEIR